LPAGQPRASRLAPRASVCAFTMVEIALSLAIIGFALVAVLGVLPKGLQVQRENREETIIGQDAAVWLNAIRTGARGYDDLTNFVDEIRVISTNFISPALSYDIRYTQTQPPGYEITNGYRIIGLLSTPRYTYSNATNKFIQTSNYVTAYVRAMSGAATEKFPQTDPNVRDLSFRYRMVSEVVRYAGWDTNWVAFDAPALTADEIIARSNYWATARNTYQNLHEIRLLFRWPLRPDNGSGNGRQVFRVAAGGTLNGNDAPYYFFTPGTYVRYQ
jgi:type II secretory pathway pseudopilin PulG